MAKLFADENFKRAVVQLLRVLGHDVVTIQEVGQQGKDDPFVLAYATALGRAVLTFNRRHFVRLHLSGVAHEGIIVCTDDEATALTQRLDQALARYPTLTNHLIRINLPP